MRQRKKMKDKKIAKTPFKPDARLYKGKWWVFFIWVFTFFFSAILTMTMSNVVKNASVLIAFIILLLIILIHIIFDIIGTAVISADETPFNSMASNKIHGAKTAIALIKNADRVAIFCNDMIGDICGIISGAITAYIVLKIVALPNFGNTYEIYIQALTGGLVAAFTIGGKSIGKSMAINNSNSILYKVAVVIQFFKWKKT